MLVADVRPVAQDLETERATGRNDELSMVSIVEPGVLPAAEGSRPRPEVDHDREHLAAGAADDLVFPELAAEMEPPERSVARPGLVLDDDRCGVDPCGPQVLGRHRAHEEAALVVNRGGLDDKQVLKAGRPDRRFGHRVPEGTAR